MAVVIAMACSIADCFQQVSHFRHSSRTLFAAAEPAFTGANDRGTVFGQLINVALNGRLLPHFRVHGGREENGAFEAKIDR